MLNLTSSLIADMYAIIQVYEPIQGGLTDQEQDELKRLKRCHQILTHYKHLKQKKKTDGNPENRFVSVA